MVGKGTHGHLSLPYLLSFSFPKKNKDEKKNIFEAQVSKLAIARNRHSLEPGRDFLPLPDNLTGAFVSGEEKKTQLKPQNFFIRNFFFLP